MGFSLWKVIKPKFETLLYHFDRKFTDSGNLLAEMADKFSFEF
jgi:hypothetical protein